MLTAVTKELGTDTEELGVTLGGASGGEVAEAAALSPYTTRLTMAADLDSVEATIKIGADGLFTIKIASAACGAADSPDEAQQLAGGGDGDGDDEDDDGVMATALEEAEEEEALGEEEEGEGEEDLDEEAEGEEGEEEEEGEGEEDLDEEAEGE